MEESNTNAIDFNSHIPFYGQLMEIIQGKITDKIWKPGSQIPSEMDLCEIYKVSRTVVRQALKELEIAGVIVKRKGVGSFVAKKKISEGLIQKLTGFYQDMVERGLTPVTKVLHQRVIPCPDSVAEYLEVKPGEEVIDIKRLRFINNEPIQLVTTYIPLHICPSLAEVDLTNRSLYEYMEKTCAIKLSRGKRFLESVLATKEEAELLGIKKGAPLLMLDSISYNAAGLVIEYYPALHRGDRSRFEVELVRLEE